MKSLSTGLVALWAAVLLISVCSQVTHAQSSAAVPVNVTASARAAAEIDTVTMRAVVASWKKVQQVIEKGNPVAEAIPVYVVSQFQEDPLSPEQQREIIEKARKADLWRDVWFITVSSHFDGRYSASVYFKPDLTHGIFRQGKVLRQADNWIKAQASPGRWPPLREMLSDYVQVSADPPECFQPDAQNMPFPMPAGFTLAEVAEIIQSLYAPKSNSNSDATRAILGIYRKGDNVEVQMGVREGGRGGTWKCRKINGAWAVVDNAELAN